MKKLLLFFASAVFLLSSCDKVETPLPVSSNPDDPYDIFYPHGDSLHYWENYGPTFEQNSNTQRNVLLEDFTGHKCSACPPAAAEAENIHGQNPSRVYIATIHAGPSGTASGFQGTDNDFTIDWTNEDGLDIAKHLANLPLAQFIGNPSGTINRIPVNGQHTLSYAQWQSSTTAALQTQLKVNIQAASNYFTETRGMFLHTEIEVLDNTIADDLYTVVYLIEDSVIGPQAMPQGPDELEYVHREVMRDCVSSGWEGIELSSDNEVAPNKYRLDYTFELESQYDADNMHVLIYVRNEQTEEVYQVIKQKFID